MSQRIGYNLRRAAAVFSAEFTHAVEGTGMRQILVGILSVVAANPGVNQGTAGRLLGIKPANMVAFITELTDAGLIMRDIDPIDRRAFTLTVTPRGAALLDDCSQRLDSHEDELLTGFTDFEKATFLDFLSRVTRSAGPVRPKAPAVRGGPVRPCDTSSAQSR
ncbi:MarR family winged helix-turn-helix transcriptional regulator [Sphingomonas floccifaciens]|uniref:MarR family winged helix-turn-helix transcriptional regulator n=1 Tax=Sphingomonas floccifaciens TaxID=1844115 RepID=UPI0036D2BE4A